jgi:hypothetical protein
MSYFQIETQKYEQLMSGELAEIENVTVGSWTEQKVAEAPLPISFKAPIDTAYRYFFMLRNGNETSAPLCFNVRLFESTTEFDEKAPIPPLQQHSLPTVVKWDYTQVPS